MIEIQITLKPNIELDLNIEKNVLLDIRLQNILNLQAGIKKCRISNWLEINFQLDIRLQRCWIFELVRVGSKFKSSSISGFKAIWNKKARNSFPALYSISDHFQFRTSSRLEFHFQLDIRLQNNLNFDLRAGSKFIPSSIFGSIAIGFLIFELALNLSPARYSRLQNILNIDLRAGSKFKSSSKFESQPVRTSVVFRVRKSNPASNSD